MVGPRDRNKRALFFWLALCMTPGVGPVTFARLLRHFKTPEAVFQASAHDLARFPRMSNKAVTALTCFDWGDQVQDEIDRVLERGCKLMTWHDPLYPPRLKEIPDPPPVLWLDGDVSESDQAAVAIVGSRGATDYGRSISARLAAELAEAGICVVSGMAMGIDAAAHRGALEAGGRTIGVLGCGVDLIYPRVNRDLFEAVPRSGALISEFPLGAEPRPGNFPLRNRVIAGLSAAVVVVEASERSGALITARLALEQNRDVLAVPGRVGSVKSRGTHALLKEGARLVETARDILDEIGPQLGLRTPGRSRPKSASEPVANLTPEGRRIWDALGDDPVHVDMIGRRSGLTSAGMAPVLLELELKGLIRQLPGMRYIKDVIG